MGAIISAGRGGARPAAASSGGDADEVWELRKTILREKLGLFSQWRIRDVEALLYIYRAKGSFEPSAAVSLAAMGGPASRAHSATKLTGSSEGELQPHEFPFVFTGWDAFLESTTEVESQRRSSGTRHLCGLHPAALGYAMVKDDLSPDPLPAPSPSFANEPWQDPAHTDDDESESESEGEDGGEDAEALPQDKGLSLSPSWDPSLRSPIFFGYKLETNAALDTATRKERQDLEAQEAKVVDRRRHLRVARLAKAVEDAAKRKEAREAKIQSMKEEMEAGQQSRQKKFTTAKRTLPEEEFEVLAQAHAAEDFAILSAQRSELLERKQRFAFLNREDSRAIEAARAAHCDADDAESSKAPRGQRLQRLARADLQFLLSRMAPMCDALESAQRELVQSHRELQQGGGSGGAQRSMVIALEGRVATAQRELKEVMAEVSDVELLLSRAMRISEEEQKVLPIYAPFAPGSDEGRWAARLFDVLVAVGLASDDSLAEKLAYLVDLFDINDNKWMDKEELCQLLAATGRALHGLCMVDVKSNEEEIESAVIRAFMGMGLDHRKGMTSHEVKRWLGSLVSRSRTLSDIFGGDWDFGQMSTLMRLKMGMVHQYQIGMIDIVDLKYTAARQLSAYKGVLHPEAKSLMHERAMAMGDDDPLKPDYTHLMRKAGRGRNSVSNAVPLSHGHLENLLFYRDTVMEQTAMKIQNIFRGRLARRAAAGAAARQAFYAARELALQDARERVADVFREREAETGVPRMKWDAKLRMRQAKLRTAGQIMDRTQVLQLMLDEAVSVAQQGVFSKFEAMAKLNGFSDDNDNPTDDCSGTGLDPNNEDADTDNLTALAAASVSASADTGSLASGDTFQRLLRESVGDTRGSKADEGATMAPVASLSGSASLAPSQISAETAQSADGPYRPEQFVLTNFNPPLAYLHQQMRSWDGVMTQLKTREFLSELPSKQLLMRYVRHMLRRGGGQASLEEDLRSHFAIIRNADVIGQHLRSMLDEDGWEGEGELMTLRKMLADAYEEDIDSQERLEVGGRILRQIAQDESDERVEAHRQARREANPSSPAEDAEVAARHKLLEDVDAIISKQEKRAEKARIELEELQARARVRERIADDADGTKKDGAAVERKHRYDWAARYEAALAAPEDAPQNLSCKYEEIVGVCGEFIVAAKLAAVTIVQEMFLPLKERTLRPSSTKPADGRGLEGGRGWRGLKLVYDLPHLGLHLRLCRDDDGIFGGSDEAAAKGRGGSERRGVEAYTRAQMQGVTLPLVAIVDYHGFRVVATSRLPIQKPIFASNGKLRRVREDICHGTFDRGEKVATEDRSLMQKLRGAAQYLNLSQHQVKGGSELVPRPLWASADVRGYRGVSVGHYYLLNFWRALPPEDPRHTPHLLSFPREQSIMWRTLRPELVKSNPIPLSPDALSLITNGTRDWEEQANGVGAATSRLVRKIIPACAEEFAGKDWNGPEASGPLLDLTGELHRRGIGMRHLGLLRSMFWREVETGGGVAIAYGSAQLRSSRDLRLILRPGDMIRLDGVIYKLSKSPEDHSGESLTLDRKVTYRSRNHEPVFKGRVKRDRDCNEAADVTGYAVRRRLLAEMTARAAKGLLRGLLRRAAKESEAPSPHTIAKLSAAVLNVITGSHSSADHIWNEQIAQGIIVRFGNVALDPGERLSLRVALQPEIEYMVTRLQSMIGFEISHSAVNHLRNRPVALRFYPTDLVGMSGVQKDGAGADISPIVRVKHSMPVLELAQAGLLSQRAIAIRDLSYGQVVRGDNPLLYFPLCERIGSVVATNIGNGGVDMSGRYIGAQLEVEGPMVNATSGDNRAVSFSGSRKTRVVSRCSVTTCPSLAVEAWVNMRGGRDTARVVAMSGLFSLQASRENVWVCTFTHTDGSEVLLRGPPVVEGSWVHLVACLDSELEPKILLYADSRLVAEILVNEALSERSRSEANDRALRMAQLDSEKSNALNVSRETAESEAAAYFKTSVGRAAIARAAANIIAKVESQLSAIDPASAAAQSLIKPTKAQARQMAMDEHTQSLIERNSRAAAAAFDAQKGEVSLEEAKARELVLGRLGQPLTVGSTCPSLRSKVGQHFFEGDICHVAFYSHTLGPDQVRQHYLVGAEPRAAESDRLFALAAEALKRTLVSAPNDPIVAARYAGCIVGQIAVQSGESVQQGDRERRLRAEAAVMSCAELTSWDSLAELLCRLPPSPIYANAFCYGLKAILAAVPSYFSVSKVLTLKQLAHMPSKFHLIEGAAARVPLRHHIAAAATVYRLVVRDPDLATIFGEVNLQPIAEVLSDGAVASLVASAVEDGDERFVNFSRHKLACSDLSDADLQMILNSRRTQVTELNLTGCTSLTDEGLLCISKCLQELRTLRLCLGVVRDSSMLAAVQANSRLTTIELSGCSSLSPEGVLKLSSLCTEKIVDLTLAYLPSMGDLALKRVAQGCRNLRRLSLQGCVFITDEGVQSLAMEADPAKLENLSLEGCGRVSDYGVIPLAERLTSLKQLNLRGVTRLTEVGGAAIAKGLWQLTHLWVDGAHNLLDSAFHFDIKTDGRRAVGANMLRKLEVISLGDCTRLTDAVVREVCSRAPSLTSFLVSGCGLLTDTACNFLTIGGTDVSAPSLKILDLSHCRNITDEGLKLLAKAGNLEQLSLDGCHLITDEGIAAIAGSCPRLQSLSVRQCRLLTDRACCHIAEKLWIEDLDMSSCVRLTDEGIEVLTLEFTGLRRLSLSRCSRLTDYALDVIAFHCKALNEVDVSECPRLTLEGIQRLEDMLQRISVIK